VKRPRLVVPNALALEQIPDQVLVNLASPLGLAGSPATVVLQRLIDERRVAAQLEQASGPCLAALETLVVSGGQLPTSTLVAAMVERFGWPAEVVASGVGEAADRCLTVGLGLMGDGETRWFCVLVHGAAAQIADAVYGISLPDPPDTATPAGLGASARDIVARLAACAHFTVKSARNGRSANRATLRKLASAIGADERTLQADFEQALDMGLLRNSGELVVPDVAALRSLAAGHVSWAGDREVARVQALVPADRWCSEEAIRRAVTFELMKPMDAPIWRMEYLLEHSRRVSESRAREASARCTGVARLSHGGHTFLRRFAAAASRGGDGHITPNLEVMLGPDADADLTLTLALAAEPVRFDRILTLKLTQNSVTAAVSLGVEPAALFDSLERVGRHGIPDNVRAMVEDWVRSARTARIRQVWSVELSSSEAADVAARALGRTVVSRPTPTLLLVDADGRPDVVLAKAGVRITLEETPDLEFGEILGGGPELGEPSSWMNVIARPELVRRFREGPRSDASAALGRSAQPAAKREVASIVRLVDDDDDWDDDDEWDDDEESDDTLGASPSDLLIVRAAQAGETPLRAHYELAVTLVAPLEQQMLAWSSRRPADEARRALNTAERSPLSIAPLGALAPKWRARLLREQRTLAGLVSAAEQWFDAAHCDGPGLALIGALRDPEFHAAWQADRKWLSAETPDRASATDTLASSSAAPSLSARPRVSDLVAQSAAEVKRLLEASIDAQTSVWLRVSSKSEGDRIVCLQPHQLLQRAQELVLLGTDIDSEEGRSFPLVNIIAVRTRATISTS